MDDFLVKACKRYFDEQFSLDAGSLAISGSYAADLATTKSDVDLILLVNDSSKLRSRVGQYIVDIYQKFRFEILITDKQEMLKIAANAAKPGYIDLGFDNIRAMERILSARPIVGKCFWRLLLEDVDRNQYSKSLARMHSEYSVLDFDDLCGALHMADYLQSIEFYRTLLWRHLEAFLCLKGDTIGRRKWISRRLLRVIEDNYLIKNGFLKYYALAELSGQPSLIIWINEAMRFHQYVNFVNLFALEDVIREEVEPYHHMAKDELFITANIILPTKIRKGFFVKSQKGSIKVDKLLAFILALCHRPITIEQMHSILNSVNLELETKELSYSRTHQAANRLLRNGLLKKLDHKQAHYYFDFFNKLAMENILGV